MGGLPPALSRPGCTCLPCWKVTKYWRQHIHWCPPKFHWLSPNHSSQYICFQASCQKMVKAKDAHYDSPILVFLLSTSAWRPSRGSSAASGICSNWRWVEGGKRGGGLSAVPHSHDLIGRTRGERRETPRCMLHLHHLEPWISLLRPLFACFLFFLSPSFSKPSSTGVDKKYAIQARNTS